MPISVPELLQFLREHQLIRSLRVIEHDETPAGKFILKVRCRLPEEYQLQIWIHYEPEALYYAYQLFTDRPLLRWDNAPHHPQISTAPHHFHDSQGKIGESSLTGAPLSDLPVVLKTIEDFLRGNP